MGMDYRRVTEVGGVGGEGGEGTVGGGGEGGVDVGEEGHRMRVWHN